ncbi:zinc-dependent alcohol dehydrogenase family protein [Tessaracoccus caeni]|uniref:zinc-dependent alcohol dehydrogenase family protein n=1 Tax=Tessaracoccus caeni TaxID=3031239 RepID=UPI0023DC583B|nr:zinc-dependent alcohol dehydrogenase family protein [Tessaracoccus caeni]MDF1489621.1 zinc-dependent alcohol dehydrogenase family protein [Tessaracoccus caeni]
MRATLYGGAYDITVGERPDPRIELPTDAVVRVLMGCVCGSDMWYYRGVSSHALGPIGHEFIGIVEDIGSEVQGLAEGDLVIAPFLWCCGQCRPCQAGWPCHCVNAGSFGNHGNDGGQGEKVHVPYADATLVTVPAGDYDDATMKSLLALSDVACTGHHAAVSARVQPGLTVAVVGDGAVGLSAVLAARRLGAERIIALSRHSTRQQVAREFGATDIVAERGQDAIDHVLELTDGYGADAVMECVGTGQSMDTAYGIAAVGSTVGAVGVPHDVTLPVSTMIFRNTGFAGGVAPARRYIPELLPDVLSGVINPGRVFDYETDLDHAPDAYRAMDERRAIKSLIRMGA